MEPRPGLPLPGEAEADATRGPPALADLREPVDTVSVAEGFRKPIHGQNVRARSETVALLTASPETNSSVNRIPCLVPAMPG